MAEMRHAKSPTEEQVEQYQRENFLSPFDAMTAAEASRYRECLEDYEQRQAVGAWPWQYWKVHVRSLGRRNSCVYRRYWTR